MNITEEELAKKAARTFFSQASTMLPPESYQLQSVEVYLPEDSHFTLGELLFTPRKARSNTALGHHITVDALRNLLQEGRHELLD